jgi:predicted CXXCH cytochrome family protein
MPDRAVAHRYPLRVVVTTALCLLAAACTDGGRTLMAPPEIPDAEFVGTEECETCHDEIVAEFATATHAGLDPLETVTPGLGCEACHGAGSLHVESGGDRKLIVNPRRSPEACYNCHVDVRGDFNQPFSHPVSRGPLQTASAKMTCGDCHDTHSGPVIRGGAFSIQTANDVCLECHPAQRGPFVFEHEAMRDGCQVCHQPHGSVNDKLLTERNATLCLNCHYQEQTAPGVILIGGRDHSAFLAQGTCWSVGCHEAIHGSQVNSSLRY